MRAPNVDATVGRPESVRRGPDRDRMCLRAHAAPRIPPVGVSAADKAV